MAKGIGAAAFIRTHAAGLAALLTTWLMTACASAPANLDADTAHAMETPMLAASTRGDLAQVQDLRARGASLNTLTEAGTPLLAAAGAGHDEVVWYLLREGADADRAAADGHTPLMAAAAAGHGRITRLLLLAGARVNAVRDSGETALLLAARKGNLAVVKALLGAGANVNVSQEGQSLLMQVVAGGDLLTTEVLLAAGADVRHRDPQGRTALAIARAHNHQDLAMLLMQAGADY